MGVFGPVVSVLVGFGCYSLRYSRGNCYSLCYSLEGPVGALSTVS